MKPYEESEAFRRLEKLADLEKRILGNIEDAKDDGESNIIPDSIRKDLRLRGSCPVPQKVLDDTIDEGTDSLIAHLNKHRAMITPGEALYHALGVKDEGVYKSSMGATLSDIISMITNRAAVSQTMPDTPMKLDDFDEPKHVRIIVRLRGMSPDMLEKSAKDISDTMNFADSLELTYMTGKKEKVGSKYAKEHKDVIKRLINDGVIIKIVKILSSGIKTTVMDKTAADSLYDDLYIEMLAGRAETI